MSQQGVSDLLQKNYPNYLDTNEIMEGVKITRRSVLNNLMRLRRRNEVEFIMVLNGKNNIFVKKYRIKKLE